VCALDARVEGDVEYGMERDEIREDRDWGEWLYVYLGDIGDGVGLRLRLDLGVDDGCKRIMGSELFRYGLHDCMKRWVRCHTCNMREAGDAHILDGSCHGAQVYERLASIRLICSHSISIPNVDISIQRYIVLYSIPKIYS
jgi:hypothetical protein